MTRSGLPPARNLGQAIEASASLASLLAGHRRAQACFEAIAPVLPPPLRVRVRPGPIDGESWALFVDNGAQSAKLRQLLPVLLQRVQQDDPAIREIRLKIHPVSSSPATAPGTPAAPAPAGRGGRPPR